MLDKEEIKKSKEVQTDSEVSLPCQQYQTA